MLNKIMNARKEALKAKDKQMPRVLNMVLNTARDKAGAIGGSGNEVQDEHVIAAIRKAVSDNNELIANHQKRGEEDKVAAFESVNSKLEALLPQTLTEAQLKELIESFGTKQIGEIMSRLKAEHTGKYVPAMASKIARAL